METRDRAKTMTYKCWDWAKTWTWKTTSQDILKTR